MSSIISVTVEPQVDPETPTTTYFDSLSAQVMGAFETIVDTLPKMEEAVFADEKQARRHLNVSDAFCVTAISGVEQVAELEGSKKLEAERSRNRLQFLEAFRPVEAKLDGVSRRLKHMLRAVKSALAGDALAIYRVARAHAQDGRSPQLSAYVAAMKRDLGRRMSTKAERDARKAARLAMEVEKAIAERELKKAA
jgi:hypothetical protein